MISQKCQYSIRAVFELARHYGQGPVKISEIAKAQAIPLRFLEIILNQLRQAGFVQSKRGATGGYLLARQPDQIAVGDIFQFVEGPLAPVACMTDKSNKKCSLLGNCVFLAMWERAAKAVSEVYDQTTFQDLVAEDLKMQETAGVSYYI